MPDVRLLGLLISVVVISQAVYSRAIIRLTSATDMAKWPDKQCRGAS